MDPSAKVFEALAANMKCIHGEDGTAWVSTLPQVCALLSAKWGLAGLVPVSNMSFNFVGRALQNEAAVVLKVSCDPRTYREEKSALSRFNGKGMVTLHAYDDEYLALLLEGLIPGTSLKGMPQEKAEPIYAEVVRAMHAGGHHLSGFRHIRDWLSSVDRATGLPYELLSQAISIKKDLLESSPSEIVLHGDLHPDNVVLGESWKAIDPKGIVGELAFELAAFNYGGSSELPGFLSVDPNRYRQWVFVRCMLGASWCVEDNMDPTQFLTWARKCQSTL